MSIKGMIKKKKILEKIKINKNNHGCSNFIKKFFLFPTKKFFKMIFLVQDFFSWVFFINKEEIKKKIVKKCQLKGW